MDPNETLRQLRTRFAELQNHAFDTSPDLSAEAEELGELFQALDNWLTKGGFLPAAWNRNT